MDYFDLHCDTPSVLYNTRSPLGVNGCHVSLDKAAAYGRYVQLAAIWSDSDYDDSQTWERFLAIRADFAAKVADAGDRAALCDGFDDIEIACGSGKVAFVLTVEDARLTCGDLSRVDKLREMGVRVMTLVWRGETIIGGAYDTHAGLTPFGRELVGRCFDVGIIPDLSHASDETVSEVVCMARERSKPVVATHSNTREICRHKRNLPLGLYRDIFGTGGVVGVSFYPRHLSDDGAADCGSVARHVVYRLMNGDKSSVCIGADFDGIELAPDGAGDVSTLPAVRDALLAAGISRADADGVMFDNAYEFARRNLS